MLRKDFALQKRCYSSNFEERFHFSKYLASKKFRFGYGLVFLSFFFDDMLHFNQLFSEKKSC